ncbi:hypothetical protein DXG03_008657 [Asterophora parasitica]|uniref:SNF2 N-terminal domain-containing protein n=1 Tax=Asterophora parasitica TaxID=117018 RepID=A0A9P7G7S8_9AGAR|nr:hypothetical protein DXG03_008657 [Asterophora parasitica]
MAFEWPDFENEQKKAKAKKKKDQVFIVDDSDEEMQTVKSKKEQLGLLFQVDDSQHKFSGRCLWLSQVPQNQTVVRFQEFQNHIGILEKKNPSLAVSRLQAVIATFLLRRMKNSTLDGKRLLELPDKIVSLVKLQFSEEELDIYKIAHFAMVPSPSRYRLEAVIIDSDDEIETPEEKEVLFGKKTRMSAEAIKLMPKFLPSTKMKLVKERLDEKVGLSLVST